ncbi:MAG: hypothetical protein R2932_56670 [Caldilineaceae bacterium]
MDQPATADAQQSAQPLPAIIIGGPPHSGKSVLSFGLTKALQARKVEHYLLRACPDGEGNWSHEAQPRVVERIRRKGQFTAPFVSELCQDLADRHLPLLVDVGGKLTAEQDRIFAHATAAILLVSDQQPAAAAAWRASYARHALPLLADLESSLHAGGELVNGRASAGTSDRVGTGTLVDGPLFTASVIGWPRR